MSPQVLEVPGRQEGEDRLFSPHTIQGRVLYIKKGQLMLLPSKMDTIKGLPDSRVMGYFNS